jgi:hypothetical protein
LLPSFGVGLSCPSYGFTDIRTVPSRLLWNIRDMDDKNFSFSRKTILEKALKRFVWNSSVFRLSGTVKKYFHFLNCTRERGIIIVKTSERQSPIREVREYFNFKRAKGYSSIDCQASVDRMKRSIVAELLFAAQFREPWHLRLCECSVKESEFFF